MTGARSLLGRDGYSAGRRAKRALALAASSSRFFDGACVLSDCKSIVVLAATSATAASKAGRFASDGSWKPLTLRTN